MILIIVLNLRIQTHWFSKKNQEKKIKKNIMLKPKRKYVSNYFVFQRNQITCNIYHMYNLVTDSDTKGVRFPLTRLDPVGETTKTGDLRRSRRGRAKIPSCCKCCA